MLETHNAHLRTHSGIWAGSASQGEAVQQLRELLLAQQLLVLCALAVHACAFWRRSTQGRDEHGHNLQRGCQVVAGLATGPQAGCAFSSRRQQAQQLSQEAHLPAAQGP